MLTSREPYAIIIDVASGTVMAPRPGWRPTLRGHSSAGRASALQAEGHRFESCCPHPPQIGPVVQMVRTLACHARGQGFESPLGRTAFGVNADAQKVTSECRPDGSGQNDGSYRRKAIFHVTFERVFERVKQGHAEFASVAQLVEQGTENPRVVGSIPTGGTPAHKCVLC